MKINVRHNGGVTILDIAGKVTIGEGDIALRQAVRSELSHGHKNLLVNLSEVTTIDSSGVGELVSSYTTVTQQGGKLKLLNPPQKVGDILQITQLITIFEVFDDEENAVASF
jgi:anti-anti-sigma factor